jgi:hypothetical protein
MFCLRAVARFAIYARVSARFFDFENIGMTGFTRLMPGVHDGQGSDLANGIATVMTVLAEALRNKPGAETEENGDTSEEDRGNTKQVFRVFEAFHR